MRAIEQLLLVLLEVGLILLALLGSLILAVWAIEEMVASLVPVTG